MDSKGGSSDQSDTEVTDPTLESRHRPRPQRTRAGTSSSATDDPPRSPVVEDRHYLDIYDEYTHRETGPSRRRFRPFEDWAPQLETLTDHHRYADFSWEPWGQYPNHLAPGLPQDSYSTHAGYHSGVTTPLHSAQFYQGSFNDPLWGNELRLHKTGMGSSLRPDVVYSGGITTTPSSSPAHSPRASPRPQRAYEPTLPTMPPIRNIGCPRRPPGVFSGSPRQEAPESHAARAETYADRDTFESDSDYPSFTGHTPRHNRTPSIRLDRPHVSRHRREGNVRRSKTTYVVPGGDESLPMNGFQIKIQRRAEGDTINCQSNEGRTISGWQIKTDANGDTIVSATFRKRPTTSPSGSTRAPSSPVRQASNNDSIVSGSIINATSSSSDHSARSFGKSPSPESRTTGDIYRGGQTRRRRVPSRQPRASSPHAEDSENPDWDRSSSVAAQKSSDELSSDNTSFAADEAAFRGTR
ncbi:hypothetical protein I302_101982 [Kwoniella bestiolae CBS 10118]|uniref:Uncharacterized protein n=1 Tax=Kwoniella bestiolae CBS 10118 TaxID=1296100 RepID=A0A1B9GDQ7_9TREE|nr:hypothetical protein I302_00666 [Kwoniella bestiolae CBS 10118]OCF29170.1 hypothetical protein I302_00666 [Kwoniella bestiolae CBS 10118]